MGLKSRGTDTADPLQRCSETIGRDRLRIQPVFQPGCEELGRPRGPSGRGSRAAAVQETRAVEVSSKEHTLSVRPPDPRRSSPPKFGLRAWSPTGRPRATALAMPLQVALDVLDHEVPARTVVDPRWPVFLDGLGESKPMFGRGTGFNARARESWIDLRTASTRYGDVNSLDPTNTIQPGCSSIRWGHIHSGSPSGL